MNESSQAMAVREQNSTNLAKKKRRTAKKHNLLAERSVASAKKEQASASGLPTCSRQLSRDDVVRCIVTKYGGTCCVDDLAGDVLRAGSKAEDVVRSLESFRSRVKVFTNKQDLGRLVVQVVVKELRLCFQYPTERGCRRNNCKHFHLCSAFVVNSCRSQSCTYTHQITDERNMAIIRRSNLHQFSAEQIKNLIAFANLIVCPSHNSRKCCPAPDLCTSLHVCADYVLGRCRRNQRRLNCRYGDAEAFGDERNAFIIGQYELGHVLDSNVQFLMKLIIVPTKEYPLQIGLNPTPSVQSGGDDSNAEPTREFILTDSTGAVHRSRQPYVWMAEIDGKLQRLEDENCSIERCFCNPNDEIYCIHSPVS